jgi:hypothetical protein
MRFRFPSVLFAFVFALVFVSCSKDVLPSPQTSTTGNAQITHSLAGQKWLLIQYASPGIAGIVNTPDSLVFSDATHYSWNGISATYSLYDNTADGHTYLVLNDTPFGKLSGIVPPSFESSGLLSGVVFSSSSDPSASAYTMWFVKQ